MEKNIVLITYSGIPSAAIAASFLPDHSLSMLASVCERSGWRPTILDLNTVSTASLMVPDELRSEIRKIERRLEKSGKLRAKKDDLIAVQKAYEDLLKHREHAYKDLARLIAYQVGKKKASVVGLKLWSGVSYGAAKIICEKIKDVYPGVVIVVGGPHVNWVAPYLLDDCVYFDYVLEGQSEMSLPHLLDYLSNKGTRSSIPGLWYRKKGDAVRTEFLSVDSIDHDYVRGYDPSVYDALVNDEKIKVFPVEDSRGCPYGCPFCPHPTHGGSIYRIKSINVLKSQMDYLHGTYGSRCFILTGSVSKAEVLFALSERNIRDRTGYRFAAFARVEQLANANIKLLADGGCVALFFGIESVERDAKRALGKSFNTREVSRMIQRCSRNGVYVILSFIYPYPQQGKRAAYNLLRFLGGVKPDTALLHPPFIAPHTEWYRHNKHYGISIRDKSEYMKAYMLNGHELSSQINAGQYNPYSVNGKGFLQLFEECDKIGARLSSCGIDDSAERVEVLIGRAIGMSPQRVVKRFYELQYHEPNERLADFVIKINKALCVPDK